MPNSQLLVHNNFAVPLPIPEEARIVRTTELEHLKRDIDNIPDGQEKFNNATSFFLGLGVPLVIQGFMALPNNSGWLPLFLGAALAIIAIIFFVFGLSEKKNKQTAILSIKQNINDFSNQIVPVPNIEKNQNA